VIVADTGAVVALIDADDQHHRTVLRLFESDPAAWVLPWAILPEVDYVVGRHVGGHAAERFREDLARGAFAVEWGVDADVSRAHELCTRYVALELGLVDGVVAAVAERLRAKAIATLDLRDFAPLALRGTPMLFPRDSAGKKRR